MPHFKYRPPRILSIFKRSKKSTFSALPPDIIFEIFDKFDSFGDLNALITASSACYRVFAAYPASILTRTAKNILGVHAWESATTVLVHQRHPLFNKSNPLSVAAFEKDILSEFVMRRSDVPQFILNQRWFYNCLEDFATFVSLLDYPLYTGDRLMDLVLSGPTSVSALDPAVSVVASDFNTCSLLCINRFYQILRSCFMCRHGDEDSWDFQETWSDNQTVQRFLVYRIMRLTFASSRFKFEDLTFQPASEPETEVPIKVPSTKFSGGILALRYNKFSRSIRSACRVRKLLSDSPFF